MHERVINVLLWNVAFKCIFSFFQDPFDLVEVSVGSKHPVAKVIYGLSEIFKREHGYFDFDGNNG